MALWEHMVKPGIKKLLIDRGKEMKQERIAALNLLMLRQAYLVRKLQSGSSVPPSTSEYVTMSRSPQLSRAGFSRTSLSNQKTSSCTGQDHLVVWVWCM